METKKETNMNRREFTHCGALGIIALMLMPETETLTGCNLSVSDLINAVLDSAAAIVTVMEPGSYDALTFKNAVMSLTQAVTAWKSGSAISDVVQALAELENVTNIIPLTAIYSPLIDVLVAGIDAVLNTIQATSLPTVRVGLAVTKRSGRIALDKPHAFQSRAGAYRHQFNRLTMHLGFKNVQI